MPENWNPENTLIRTRVLRTLTAAEAAETGRWHSQQGDYRSAAVWHQLAGALAAADNVCNGDCSHPEHQPKPLRMDQQIREVSVKRPPSQPTTAVPLPPRWSEVVANDAAWTPGSGPSGNGDRDLADTASIPLPESHAPTTCVYAVRVTHVQNNGAVGSRLCGELIRWSEPNGWHHVSDRHLGESSHPATPQGTPGPLPRRLAEHLYVAGDDYLCVTCGALASDTRHTK